VVSIRFGLERGNIQGNKLRNEIGPRPIKQKANLGASYNLRVREFSPSLNIASSLKRSVSINCHTDGVRLHRRRQNFWTLDALKRLKYFVNAQLRD